MRLLGREQLASRGSSGTCGVMANHTKSITRSLPAPKVCGDAGIRTTDHHTGRRFVGTSLTTSPLVVCRDCVGFTRVQSEQSRDLSQHQVQLHACMHLRAMGPLVAAAAQQALYGRRW